MKCWASNVSECNGRQSKEHYISQGLFSCKMIYVENAPFLDWVDNEISLKSLSKKCLCEKHNSELSNYDQSAVYFGNALKFCRDLFFQQQKNNISEARVHQKNINREFFARWFLKTYIGMSDFFLYEPEISKNKLANLVYRSSSILKYVDLELAMEENERFSVSEKVRVAPLEKLEKTVGMSVEFYGIRVQGIFCEEPLDNLKKMEIQFVGNPNKESVIISFV
ncbi:hypothetical protein WN093_11990 [Gammaproteobacteria bacterium AS21]